MRIHPSGRRGRKFKSCRPDSKALSHNELRQGFLLTFCPLAIANFLLTETGVSAEVAQGLSRWTMAANSTAPR